MTKKAAKSTRGSLGATITLVSIYILLFAGAFFFTASRYKIINFGNSQIDEIIFYLNNGISSGKSDSFLIAIRDNLLFMGILFFILILPVLDLFRNRTELRINLSFLGKKQRSHIFNPSHIRLRYKLLYAVVIFCWSVWTLAGSLGVPEYIRALNQSSTLLEQYYVDPKTASLTFPTHKRNLIYIFLESMESTLASEEQGGLANPSVIPELEKLALRPDVISFSNKKTGLGGALPATGTTWTVGGMVAQSSGVYLKESLTGADHDNSSEFNHFLPGAFTLGDVLQREGYNQTFLMGSAARFGGRDTLLTQHGNYTIHDYEYAKKTGKIPQDYNVWWGFEDKKLFEYAKEEASRLASLDKPFNLQLLTADTHFTDGYLDETCATPFSQQYDNVFACSSKQVAAFVEWIEQQPFAKDTTIILSGDHLGMQTSYYDGKINHTPYQRTIYNAFINPVISPLNTHSRTFTTMDMYPSTLAAMGVHIQGERLGLGTNLFSSVPTLAEEYDGIDALNAELAKRSEYYERKILN